jgi:hypothetical protein
MPSKVFWGSPRQARLAANETLPAKLDLILDELHLRDRVKGENVAIKLHVGSNIVYSTRPASTRSFSLPTSALSKTSRNGRWLGWWKTPPS